MPEADTIALDSLTFGELMAQSFPTQLPPPVVEGEEVDLLAVSLLPVAAARHCPNLTRLSCRAALRPGIPHRPMTL
eukprot:1238658-Prymnesium_polylepis.1